MPAARSVSADHTIDLQVLRMDGKLGEAVTAVFRWTIFGQRDAMLSTQRAVYREPMREKTYEELAAAHARVIEALSRDMAESVGKVLDR